MSGIDASAPLRPRMPWRVILLVWALLSAFSAVWAAATPLSASPDEPAHIVRAASVVRGQWIGTPSRNGHIVQVPRYIAQTDKETCFAFHPEVTANCADTQPAAPDALTRATTTAGLYNPLYYLAVGWPSLLFHNGAGIYAMRIVSGILASLFAALAFGILWLLPRRRLPILGFAVAVTPMLLFLDAAVNPNGLEATATLAVFAGVLAATLDPRPELLRSRAAIVAAAGFIAVNTRGLSPLWVMLAVLMPFVLLTGRDLLALLRRRAVLTAVATIGAGTAAALAWTIGTGSLLYAVTNPGQTPQHYMGVGTNVLSGFFLTLQRTVEYSHGLIGVFGWLDTPAPPEVFFVWSAVIGVLLVAAFSLLRSRSLTFAVVLLAAFVLMPPVLQGLYITGGGIIWQGRYNFPMFLCLIVGLATIVGDGVELPYPSMAWRRLVSIVVVGLAAGQFYAFENTLRRYSVGGAGSLKALLLGSGPWNAPAGNVLWLTTFAVLCVVGAWLTLREAVQVEREPIVSPRHPITQAATGL